MYFMILSLQKSSCTISSHQQFILTVRPMQVVHVAVNTNCTHNIIHNITPYFVLQLVSKLSINCLYSIERVWARIDLVEDQNQF